MRKISFILATFVLAVTLLVVEIIIVRSAARYDPQVEVVFARTNIPEKTVIQENMLDRRKIDLHLVNKQLVKDLNDIVGKEAKIDIEEGEMIFKSRIGNRNEVEEIKVIDTKNRLFTVEFKGDQANGWWLMADQYVDIIFIPTHSSKNLTENENNISSRQYQNSMDISSATLCCKPTRLRNIRVAALIDDKGNLLKNSRKDTLPRYISFEVTDVQDEFLAYAKSHGRIEISVIP